MDHIQRILASYPIQAVSVEQITDNVSKVFDGKHTYALKKSRLTDATVTEWKEVYHQAYQYQIYELLPVGRTIDGSLTTLFNNTYYYLTPWISTENINKNQQMKRLYDTLGSIHAKTKQTIHINVEMIVEQFKHYQKQIKDHQSFLSECIALFEQSRFMAPVELLFCTHYRDIELLLQALDSQVSMFIDAINEESVWNYSLCHGKLDLSNCLIGDQAYIMNWEDARYDNPVRDLSTLYRMVAADYDSPADDFMQNFSVYTDKNPLSEAELSLLAIYLLDPTAYIDLVKQYRSYPAESSQVNMVQQLQREYRTLSYAMKWIHFTEDDEIDPTES